MNLRTVLLSGASLLAMTSYAHADPVSIGSAVISGFLAVGAGGLLPTASAAAIGLTTIGIATTVANVALQAAFLRSPPAANPQEVKNTSKGQEGPGRYATGRVRLGGEIAFGNTVGYDIYRFLLHCFGRIDGIEEYFYDGRSIVVDSDGWVSSPPWARQGGSNLRIESKMGTGSETVWGALQADFPTIWTSDHRARGIGQTLLRAINPGTGEDRFQTLFQGGVKELEATARVGRFFDPRDDGTEWSLNGVLQCLHWFRRLPGISDDIIDFDGTASAADDADQNVATRDGSAPRCQVSGGWKGPLTYDIVEDMLESAGLEMRVGADDKYRLAFIEDDPEPEITFLDRHIIDRTYQSGDAAAKRPNILRLKYFSPERQFQVSEIDLTGADWARVQDEIDIYGEQQLEVQLVFCCDASQAQRIGRRLFHMARAETGVLRTTLAGIAAIGKKTIRFELPDVGEDGASIFVTARKGTARINLAEGICEIPYQVIPEVLKTPWNAATMERPAPPPLQNYEYESDLDTPDPPYHATVVQYPGGGYETRIRFGGVEDGTTPEANYREYDGDTPEQWAAMTEYDGDTGGAFARVSGDRRGRVDFRVRWFNDDGEGSYFSDLLEMDPLDINNTRPEEPDVSESAGTLTVVTLETHVVKFTVDTNYEGEGWETDTTLNDVRPGEQREIALDLPPAQTNATTLEWRVAAYSSDDSRSFYANGSITIPGTGP